MLKVLSNILCDLDPKVKVIGQKVGICNGVPSTSALVQNYILSTITLKYNTVLIQIRPDILLGLIWIQTVVKGYLQDETLAGNE